MEVKPGYKQTEVGGIPEEWDAKPFGDLFDFSGGFSASRAQLSEKGHCYLHYGDIHGAIKTCVDTQADFQDIPKLDIPLKKVSSKSLLKDGDVVFVDASEDDEGTSRHVVVVNKGNLPFVSGLHTIVAKSKTDQLTHEYRRYCFQTAVIRRQFLFYAVGTKVSGISKSNIAKLLLPFPPDLPEQRAIAAALSDVDALLAGLDRLISKKRDLKQAAMQQLLTGQTRLPGFSGAWEVKALGDVVHPIRGGIYGEEKSRGGLKASAVATTAHIELDDTWNSKAMPIRYFTAEKLSDYSTVEGDLIVVKSSGSAASIQSGKLGFIDAERAGKFVFSNFLMLLRPTAVLPRFLYFYLCSHNVKKLLPTLVEASTYPNIRLGDYLEVKIPVLSPAEQTAIAAVLSDMDAELAALEARRDKSRLLKQGMMQELLTGKTRLI